MSGTDCADLSLMLSIFEISILQTAVEFLLILAKVAETHSFSTVSWVTVRACIL